MLALCPWQQASYQTLRGFLLHVITSYYTLLHLITSFVRNKYLLLLYPWQRSSYQALRGFLLHVITSYYTLLSKEYYKTSVVTHT